MNTLILAVIQARGGSKGIPKKNIYPLHGHPLISYSISAALNSNLVTDLVVSTDSEEIAGVARKYGATVPFLRPDELAGDLVPSVTSLIHAVKESEKFFKKRYDYIIELPCVSPLRHEKHIDEALRKLIDTSADSVISMVNTGEKHPIRLKKIENDQIVDFCTEYPEPAIGSRRQDLKPLSYIRNGAIYAMTRDCLINEGSRHGKDSRPYIMEDFHSVNIDTYFDLKMVEFLIGAGYCLNSPKPITSSLVECLAKDAVQKVLISAPTHFLPRLKEELIQEFDCIFYADQSGNSLKNLLEDREIWIVSPCPKYPIDESVISLAPRLKVIATPSTGTNHIDLRVCRERGIEVICLRDTPEVEQIKASSEYTFLLLMQLLRRPDKAFQMSSQGRWREIEDQLRGHELSGKTLGVIGFGRIGGNISKFALAFDMRVVAFDNDKRKMQSPLHVSFKSNFEDVLKEADIVAICVHLNDETKGMVNDYWFGLMKKGAYFINTSRGEVLNEKALINALESQKIAAAALDVISNEQASNIYEHELIKYSRNNQNLLISPHIAGLTFESEEKALRSILRQIREVLA